MEKEPRKHSANLSVELHKKLAHHCLDREIKLQQFIEEAVREKLARDSQPKSIT